MNQRKVKVPSATQAAMQDKTLRSPVKKESPPLGPALGKYKGFVEEQQKGEWGDMFGQLPTDEADVALMVAPFGSLSKPLQNFAKKLAQTKTVKEGVDVALQQITGLGMKAQDLVDFSKKLLDIQSTVPGGMEALKPKHFKALRLANDEVVGIKDRGRRSVDAGRHRIAPEGSPHPASGAEEVEVKYDILGNKVDDASQAVPKNIKDVNQPGVDEAFDSAKADVSSKVPVDQWAHKPGKPFTTPHPLGVNKDPELLFNKELMDLFAAYRFAQQKLKYRAKNPLDKGQKDEIKSLMKEEGDLAREITDKGHMGTFQQWLKMNFEQDFHIAQKKGLSEL